ncbi:MAG: hypothetical protein ACLSTO_06510 [Bilophila wadsworthia]
MYAAVQKLLDEDVTLKLSRDEESGDILLSAWPAPHRNRVERAKRRQGGNPAQDAQGPLP